MRAIHDPLATAETCAGCAVDPGGYDHEAVRARRPRDFDGQVEQILRDGLRTGHIAQITLGVYAVRGAKTYLADRARSRKSAA